MVSFLSYLWWWCRQNHPLLKVHKNLCIVHDFNKRNLWNHVRVSLTKHPAQSQTFTNGKKIPADSGWRSNQRTGRCKFLPEEDKLEWNWTNGSRMTCFLRFEFGVLLLLELTLVTSRSSTAKADAQTTRTKISWLIGLWNHFGNMSLTVVIKLSTSTNWWQSQSCFYFMANEIPLFCSINCVISIITCESTPSRMNITKKQTVQNCGSGIRAVAWG